VAKAASIFRIPLFMRSSLLAIQSSEYRVPYENYDPSEAVSPSSENENEETAQEQDENVEMYLDEEMQDQVVILI
jgi:hypothetical protein